MKNRLDKTAFLLSPEKAAMLFLGRRLHIFEKTLIITEIEAYFGKEDCASHARFEKSKRSEIMYREGGILYIYLIYGMHLCLNIVMGNKGEAGAVLIRAGETAEGSLVTGPGRVGKYLGITKEMNGLSLIDNEQRWIEKEQVKQGFIEASPRIGIAYAGEWASKPLRFCLKDS